jgi:NAD-dependent dihydropyrimidine dehydrogenase PreA subunit
MASTIHDACTSCGICLPLCPTDSIHQGTLRFVIDADSCIDCNDCVRVCPVNAIEPAPAPKPDKKTAS